MRKRLRKKRRLAEFRENIFGVRFSLRDGLALGTDDEFLWRFIEGAVEANGLVCGGGGQGAAWEFCVQLAGQGSPSEAQRLAVGTWLGRQAEVRAYELGDFFDGWHGPDEAPYAGLRSGRERSASVSPNNEYLDSSVMREVTPAHRPSVR